MGLCFFSKTTHFFIGNFAYHYNSQTCSVHSHIVREETAKVIRLTQRIAVNLYSLFHKENLLDIIAFIVYQF